MLFLARKWEGEFQVVVSNNKQTNKEAQLSKVPEDYLTLLGGPSESMKSIKTEVQILKSPSVLMPIFEYVKLKKEGKDKNFNKWKFSWRKRE